MQSEQLKSPSDSSVVLILKKSRSLYRLRSQNLWRNVNVFGSYVLHAVQFLNFE